MTLFDDQLPPDDRVDRSAPLAERLRPRRLDDVVGQQAVVGADGFLRRAIAEDRVPSLIFWGPPGCGKTTLAKIVAAETRARFVPFSAVTSGIKEVKAVMADAARFKRANGTRTLLFVDEIHRFNKAQQDAFLPYVEQGEVVLVGATTENPSFELNAALLSRCRVVVLERLEPPALVELLERALADDELGVGGGRVSVRPGALEQIAQLSSGDARRALNLLELVVTDAAADGKADVDSAAVERIAQRKILVYDKSGEEHFNLISALHKSMRESDPDGSLYWLGRMLAAGEDPLYIARRLVRFASEDVGLADPGALSRAIAAWEAYRRLGSPEGELALAQLTIDLALAPKSNAVYRAYGKVRRTIAERPADPVPKAIRNAPTELMKREGYGSGYRYAHDQPEGVGGVQCLPDALAGETFYEPKPSGAEREIGERLAEFRRLRRAAAERHGPKGETSP